MYPVGRVRDEQSRSSRRALVLLLTPAFLMLMVWAVQSQGLDRSGSDIAAKVNGVPITTLELERTFQAKARVPYAQVQEDPRAKEVLRQVLGSLIDRELLLQQAKSLQMAVPPQQVDSQMQQLVQRFPSQEAFEQALAAQHLTMEALKQDIEGQLLGQQLVKKEVLDKVNVSARDVQTFYDQHQDKYVEAEQIRARHILIRVPPQVSPADEAKLKSKADDALKRAKTGEDFAVLAKEVSDDGSKENGGDLGFFPRGRMVPPFEEAAFALQPGQISDIVRSQFGYHIIKAEEHKTGRALAFDEAKAQVQEDLTQEQTTTRYQQYVAGLRHKAKVEVLLQ